MGLAELAHVRQPKSRPMSGWICNQLSTRCATVRLSIPVGPDPATPLGMVGVVFEPLEGNGPLEDMAVEGWEWGML